MVACNIPTPSCAGGLNTVSYPINTQYLTGRPTPMGLRTVAGKYLRQRNFFDTPNGFPIRKKVSVHTTNACLCCHGNTSLTGLFLETALLPNFPGLAAQPGAHWGKPEEKETKGYVFRLHTWRNLVGKAGFPETPRGIWGPDARLWELPGYRLGVDIHCFKFIILAPDSFPFITFSFFIILVVRS